MSEKQDPIFSDNQRRVLFYLEGKDKTTTGEIAEALTIPHPTAKQTMQRLLKLGLIQRQGLGRGAYYYLKQENEIYDVKGNKLITVYKGLDSFKKMFKELERGLKADDFYWAFAFKDEYYDKQLGQLLVDFHTQLTNKGVDDRTIVHEEVREIVKRNYRHVPKLQIKFTEDDVPTGMIILADRIVNLVWGKAPIAIMVQSHVMAERYQDFFCEAWGESMIEEIRKAQEITKPGNTPIVTPKEKIYGTQKLFIKDETKNPTRTFKDRLAYEMIRPQLEDFLAGKKPKSMTFGSIFYGNTAKAMGYYVQMLNKMVGKEVARAVVFIPPHIEKRTYGPDTEGTLVTAREIIADIKKTCTIIPIDLSKKIYRPKDLEEIARDAGKVIGEFVDITEGLNRPAYVNVIIEAIEQQLRFSPDYAIVPFGAGILCNEVIDYVKEHQLRTKVIPVSSGNPDTIAVMLYGPIWVDTVKLACDGQAFTRHEPLDRKGRPRDKYLVYHVCDEDMLEAMEIMKQSNIQAEPSGASGIAMLKHLKEIDPEFKPDKHSVLVINTGDGLLNY